MEHQESPETLYFYSSKIKLFILFFFMLTLIVLAIPLGLVFIIDDHIIVTRIWTVMAILLFVCFLIIVFKKLLHPKPYLILTDDTLTICPPARKKMHSIAWSDIISIALREVSFNKFIHIYLRDQDKLHIQVTQGEQYVSTSANATYDSFVWSLIKRKDRRELVDELDRRAGQRSRLKNQLYPNVQREQKSNNRRINRDYMLKSYGYSLILAIVAIFLFVIPDSSSVDTLYVIVSFILYPFAKAIYDVLIGFKIKDKLEKQSGVTHFLYTFMYICHLLLFLFSFYVGPIGILYVLIKTAIHTFKKK